MPKRDPRAPRRFRTTAPPRPEPQIRVSPKGAIVDGIDSYSRAVVGARPENFGDLLGFANDILPVAVEACGIDKNEERSDVQQRAEHLMVRDTLLLAAWALTETANQGNGENPIAIVQRLKQVIAWCAPKTDDLTVLDVLENKNRELARLVGERLARHEGFVLTIFDQGGTDEKRGSSTWISSAARRTSISLLRELVEHMAEDQAARS